MLGVWKYWYDIDEYKITVEVYIFHQDYKLQIRKVWSEIYITD